MLHDLTFSTADFILVWKCHWIKLKVSNPPTHCILSSLQTEREERMGGKVVPGLDRSAQQHNNKRLDTQEDTMAGN